MKSTVSMYDFERAFYNMGRKDSFSYGGKAALFNHLEELEEDTGEEIELDVIALCCEYSEFETALEAAGEYGYDPGEEIGIDYGWYATCSAEEKEKRALDWLQEQTTVIAFSGGVIVQGF